MSQRVTAIEYLIPPSDSFWQWVDNGRGIAWKSGETIAFRPEVQAVVQKLTPGGLPSFTAIVLLLAATRDGWSTTSDHLLTHARHLASPGGGDPTSAMGVTLRAIGHRLEADTAKLIAQLDRIAQLPREVRQSPPAKAAIAEVIFEERQSVVQPDVAEIVIAEMQNDPGNNVLLTARPKTAAVRQLIDSIDVLGRGLQNVDGDRLRLLLRTGLEQEITPPDENLAPARRVSRLLGEVADDPELAGVSRLARRLLAAVHVPRSLHRHQDLPIGGVADLTNRGQLDRLVMTELANDGLTLAVRIAMNEALYLQRESPPREPPHRRVMLLDTGIRTWGVPRVFITAVALALSATGDADGELLAFRPGNHSDNEPEIVPVDLTSRAGLLSQLEVLDCRPHFAYMLQYFFGEASSGVDEAEVFVITHEDVWNDPLVRNLLPGQLIQPTYVATVSRDGAFCLWLVNKTGKSLVRQAKLDLDQLLTAASPKVIRPLLDPAHPSDLPVVLGMRPFPLLLPPGTSPKRITRNDAGSKVAITRDRQLICWQDGMQGARVLADDMPNGRLDLFRFDSNGSAIVALFTTFPNGIAKCVLHSTRLDEGVSTSIQLTGIDEKLVGVTLRENIVFVIGQKRISAHSLHAPEPLATLDNSRFTWLRDRTFASQGRWYVLSFTGSQLTFEQVPESQFRARPMFEVHGANGPLFMDSNGKICEVGSGMDLLREGPPDNALFEGISADGRSIIAVKNGLPPKRYQLDLAAGTNWQPVAGTAHSLFNCNSQQFIYQAEFYQLRTRFTGIMVGRSGELLLHAGLGKLREIKLVNRDLRLVDPGYLIQLPDETMHTFVRINSPKGRGYSLRSTRWKNGSQAVLDSRGMLHLKSADKTVPELTILLTNQNALGGWSSDGRFYGPNYFHGRDAADSSEYLGALISNFTRGLQ